MSEELNGKGHGEKLSRKQEDGIAALLTSGTIAQAAKTVGVGEATLRRWMKISEFANAYEEARLEAVRTAIIRVQTTAGEAVDTLRAIMTNPECPVSSRVSAAKTLLENTFKAWELYDLDARIKTLEGLAEIERNR